MYQNAIPAMIWAEDAINQFGCRVVVGHLFLVVPNPSVAYKCLLASGQYTQCHHFTPYNIGILQDAPRVVPMSGRNSLPIALLRASDWANLPPLPLSPDPQFPPLHVLLASLLQTWLQYPYSDFSSSLSGWISSIYGAHKHPALVPPAEGEVQESYLTVSRAMPARIRQLHVDMVYERIFILAHTAYLHYNAVAQAVDMQMASSNDSDLIYVPSPSAEMIGGNTRAWYIHFARFLSQKLIIIHLGLRPLIVNMPLMNEHLSMDPSKLTLAVFCFWGKYVPGPSNFEL
jgi:hypothetical protein